MEGFCALKVGGGAGVELTLSARLGFDDLKHSMTTTHTVQRGLQVRYQGFLIKRYP